MAIAIPLWPTRWCYVAEKLFDRINTSMYMVDYSCYFEIRETEVHIIMKLVSTFKCYHLSITKVFLICRFHSPAKEPALNYDVVLSVDDDVKLSVVQYRNKLYEVQKKL